MKKTKTKTKKIEPLCRNCKLYDWDHKFCKVIILYENSRINVPMDPNDLCLYEEKFTEIIPNPKDEEKPITKQFSVKPEQVRMWVEDRRTGKKTNKDGIVKIEYPEGFYGKEED